MDRPQQSPETSPQRTAVRLSAEGVSPPVGEPRSAARRRGRPFPRRWLVFGLLLLLALPASLMEIPREISRWYFAAAVEQHERAVAATQQGAGRDVGRALQRLDAAIRWDPGNIELHQQRSLWNLQARDFDAALADAARAIELAPDEAAGYLHRADLLMRMGRPAEAIPDWDRLVELARQGAGMSLYSALNGRAYFRALAKVQLEEGLQDAIEAVERVEAARRRPAGPLTLRAAPDDLTLAMILDTRGYLYYLLGDDARALADLNEAIRLLERRYRAIEVTARGMPPAAMGADPRMLDPGLATIYHHRYLVQLALGRRRNAELDLRRMEQLGWAPEFPGHEAARANEPAG